MTKFLLAYFLSVSSIIGCDTGPSSAPPMSSLVGNYSLTDESRKLLTAKGFRNLPSNVYVQLDPSGTVSFVNIPDCWHLSGCDQSKYLFLSAGGNWKIGAVSPKSGFFMGWPLEIDIPGGQSIPPRQYVGDIAVMDARPPYRLFARIGNPDFDSENLVYRKVD